MVTKLRKGSSQKSIKNILNKLSKNTSNGFDAKKYNGIIDLKEDALLIQKKLRNEWN